MTSGGDVLAAARGSRLHWSWLPGLGALSWVLAADHFPSAGVNGAAAILVVLLIVPCVVVHELARQIGIRSAGVTVVPVTLWPAGGVPNGASPPPVRADLRGALAAPLASIALAAALRAAAGGGSGGAVIDVLARFNAAFGILNLIPALPLDGGVLLRSVLRARGRSFAEATATAARGGAAFAILLTATGIARAATDDLPGGIGLAVAGAITAGAARAHAPETPLAGRVTRAGVIAGVPLVLLMLAAVAALYHPPLALASPGTPLDVTADIEIAGRHASINGRYVAASVVVQEPTALHAFVSLFRRGHYLIRRDTLRPLVEDRFLPVGDAAGLFRLSRDYAAVAAARALGIPVEIGGSGVRVLAAGPRARQAGFLPGDTIVAADDAPVERLEQLREIVVARAAGTSFALTIERAGIRSVLSIRSTANERSGRVPYLDMQGETRDFRYELPVNIRFRTEGGLGPSAALAYTLAITDLLDARDLARGRTIAATGRVDLTGGVAPIVGAIAKQWSALDARAALFVVHEADANSLRDAVLPVLGVETIREAVERLLAF